MNTFNHIPEEEITRVRNKHHEITTKYLIEDHSLKRVIDPWFDGPLLNFDIEVTRYLQQPECNKHLSDAWLYLSKFLAFFTFGVTYITSIEAFPPIAFCFGLLGYRSLSVSHFSEFFLVYAILIFELGLDSVLRNESDYRIAVPEKVILSK